MDNEKMFYNAVAIAMHGDPSRVRHIRKKCGDAPNPWQTAYEILGHNGPNPPDLPDPEVAWEKLENEAIRIIFAEDPEFPPLLREMHHPPIAIYALGELPPGERIAIVGTRRATSEGKVTAKKFARELAHAGFTIVSGLALGIDAAAHEGCLDGGGKTIAILAGGLDAFYPSENERLGKKILSTGGGVVSEYPIGEPPLPHRFLERNRIVCGLSKAVLVIECPERSGSLATAAYALQQNRDLFVVPGSIVRPNFFGSHALIRQGAELVTKPEDILETYGVLEKAKKEKMKRDVVDATEEERLILSALGELRVAGDVDKIIAMTKLEPQVVNQVITLLIIKGLVKETITGYIIE